MGLTISETYPQDGRIVHPPITGIAILAGLPVTLFQGVTIHELGHVWLVVHDIRDLPVRDEEGFCELLAHRYYQHLNTPDTRYYASSIEKNPNPVYGDGFRRAHALAGKYSFSRLLTNLETEKQFPR